MILTSLSNVTAYRMLAPKWAVAPTSGAGPDGMAAGAKGILFRSRLSPSGTNLALYVDELEASDSLDVHDPSGALPRNQSSRE